MFYIDAHSCRSRNAKFHNALHQTPHFAAVNQNSISIDFIVTCSGGLYPWYWLYDVHFLRTYDLA